MTSAGLRHFGGRKLLKTLRLYGTRIADVGLKELAGLRRLQELRLNGTAVTDQ